MTTETPQTPPGKFDLESLTLTQLEQLQRATTEKLSGIKAKDSLERRRDYIINNLEFFADSLGWDAQGTAILKQLLS